MKISMNKLFEKLGSELNIPCKGLLVSNTDSGEFYCDYECEIECDDCVCNSYIENKYGVWTNTNTINPITQKDIKLITKLHIKYQYKRRKNDIKKF